MSEFTKGPWEMVSEETTDRGHYTAPQVFSVADPDKPKIVCTLAVRNGTAEYANAHLIAAAPELLEALKDALLAMNHLGDILNGMDAAMPEDVQKVGPAWNKARLAISKAEGK